jgi:PAS domain S-box-containing protein
VSLADRQHRLVAIFLMAGVFVVDLWLPLGVAGGVPYVAVVLVALGIRRWQEIVAIAFACGALTLVGALLSPDAGATEVWKVYANRLLALFVIGVTTAVGLQRKWAEARAIQVSENLKQRKEELDQANQALRKEVAEHRSHFEALRESTAQIEAILQNTVEGIITIDLDGIIQSANPATIAMFGYEASELIGKNSSMLTPPSGDDENGGVLRRNLDAGQSRIIDSGREITGRRKNGTSFPVVLSVGKIELDTAPLFVCTWRDVSETRKAERQARDLESLAEVSTLTAGIAHDIGTPMNVILGYANMLGNTVTDEKSRKHLQIIGDQVRRVTELIQSLLNFVRPSEARHVSVDLAAILDAALLFFQEKLKKLEIDVERSFDEVPAVSGDPDKLQQLFLNLFVNAADAMPEGGKLRVGLGLVRDYVEIRVADTGVGISSEPVEKIFEPFYTSKERGKGTGLGLAVSRGIVIDHGGEIAVSSELGKGTEFRILVPVQVTKQGPTS